MQEPPKNLPVQQSTPVRTWRTGRFLLALVVALASDLVGMPLELAPPLSIGLDVVTALVLWAILGRGWLLLVALVLEAIPGLGLVPFWTMAVCGMEFITASAQVRMKQLLGRKGVAGEGSQDDRG